MRKRLRYRDLLAAGIVRNRTTLGNWIKDRGFPPGQMTGPNSRTWGEDEVEDYLNSRPTAAKKVIPAKRPRGRPRKNAAAEIAGAE